MDARLEIERAIGRPISNLVRLSGGCVGEVYRFDGGEKQQYVAKVDEGVRPCLDIEAYMLEYLALVSDLPVPEVIFKSSRLLIMSYLPGENAFTPLAERHAAELLAELHGLSAAAFGMDRPTMIAAIQQPNDWKESWVDFFGEQRLLHMALEGVTAGQLPLETMRRLERLSLRLDRWLLEPPAPGLVHGDVWTGNVLAVNGRVTGFIDPAVYYADPEVELAFITLFGTFGEPFFTRYSELRLIRPGFFEERRDIYNLYPLLVHARLFGEAMLAQWIEF